MRAVVGETSAFETPSQSELSDTDPVMSIRDREPHPQNRPRVGDDIWNLRAYVKRPTVQPTHCIADFNGIPEGALRVAAKTYIHEKLNQPRVSRGGRLTYLKPAGVHQEFRRIRLFFEHLRGRGHTSLHTFTQEDVVAYAVALSKHCKVSPESSGVSIATQARKLDIVRSLGESKTQWRPDEWPSPWPGQSGQKVIGALVARSRPREQTTERIPREIMGPLLQQAMLYVDVASDDIAKAAAEWAALRDTRSRGGSSLANFEDWLSSRQARGRGLPAASNRSRSPSEPEHRAGGPLSSVNLSLIIAMAGLPTGSFHKRKRLIERLERAINVMPLEQGGLETQPSVDPVTGGPWADGFAPSDMLTLQKHLMTACYIVTSYLSGMRDSEVPSIRRNAVRRHRSESGAERLVISSTAYKNEDEDGAAAEWVVIEPVARAIAVLEQLHDGDLLFGWSPMGRGASRLDEPIIAINDALNEFVTHVNRFTPGGKKPIPERDGKPWHLHTRQFRKTMAWHIANQPFGMIALQLQYRHLRIATSLGYAGTPDSGVPEEIANEEVLKLEEDLLDRYRRRVDLGESSTGRNGPAMDRQLDSISSLADEKMAAAALATEGPVIARDDVVRALLRDPSRLLYPGPLADCSFRPGPAACLRGQPMDKRDKPILALCEPDECANASLSATHREAWAGTADRTALLLTVKGQSDDQRAVLRQHQTRARRLADGA